MVANGLRTPKGPASPPYSHGPYEWSEGVALNKPYIGFKRYSLIENFEKLPQKNATVDQVYTTEAARVCNTAFEILGTNVADADITHATTLGAVELKTHGADNDQVIVLPHLDTSYTGWTGVLWGTENQVIWECVIRTGSDVTTGILMWLGLKLTNTPTTATDDDQVFFKFSTDDADTNWEIEYSVAGTDTEIDTGVVVAVNTNYYFRIEIDSSRKAHCYINNIPVGTTGALTNDVDLIPYVGVQCLDSTPSSQYLYLVKEAISRIIFE